MHLIVQRSRHRSLAWPGCKHTQSLTTTQKHNPYHTVPRRHAGRSQYAYWIALLWVSPGLINRSAFTMFEARRLLPRLQRLLRTCHKNDDSGRDVHAENVGYIGVVWARVPGVVGLNVVRKCPILHLCYLRSLPVLEPKIEFFLR